MCRSTEEKHKDCESEKIAGRLYERPDIASDKVAEKISDRREMSACYGEERKNKKPAVCVGVHKQINR